MSPSPPALLWMDHFATPIGEMVLVANEKFQLCLAGFTEGHPRAEKQVQTYTCSARYSLQPAIDPGGLCSAFLAYFAGEIDAVSSLQIADRGTEFQQKVWTCLRTIPTGETRSYGELANTIGNPKACRAVGMANGKNTICIAVPCHRVIGANGSLTGYAGGIERKTWLLTHEGWTGGKPSSQLDLALSS